MTEEKLDAWFCSLTVKQKEHIACKILIHNGKDPHKGLYPFCSDIWMMIDPETKEMIHDHCTDSHGMWIQPGGDGHIYSY